jgi:hypothetical protein
VSRAVHLYDVCTVIDEPKCCVLECVQCMAEEEEEEEEEEDEVCATKAGRGIGRKTGRKAAGGVDDMKEEQAGSEGAGRGLEGRVEGSAGEGRAGSGGGGGGRGRAPCALRPRSGRSVKTLCCHPLGGKHKGL